jgi:hypothetical protein
MRHLDEPIDVEAVFLADGSIVPRRFRRGRSWKLVTSVGRSWRDAQGAFHILIMDEASRVHELKLDGATLVWRLVGLADPQEAWA